MEIKELENSDIKKLAFDQYVNLAKLMKTYEESKFKEFSRKSEKTLQAAMLQNVLTLQPQDRKAGENSLILRIVF